MSTIGNIRGKSLNFEAYSGWWLDLLGIFRFFYAIESFSCYDFRTSSIVPKIEREI